MAEPWRHDVGTGPSRVTVLERAAKDGMLYVRWFDAQAPSGDRRGGDRYRSLGRRLRDDDGRIDPATEAWAIEQAEVYSRQLADAPALTPHGPSLAPTIDPGRLLDLVYADTERLIEEWGLEAARRRGETVMAAEAIQRCAEDLARLVRMWKHLGG